MPENKPDGLKCLCSTRAVFDHRLCGGGGFGSRVEQKKAGIRGADDLMAVVSSQNKEALTVHGKGDL